MKSQSSLNHTFRLVWSDTQNAFVAVAEHIRGKGKSKTSGVAAAVLIGALSLFGSSSALAGPDGGVITSGTGSISQDGNVTNINQTSDTLKADWNSFNIEANETVNFNQPSKTSLAVNNILDTNGTRIMGNLNANGQVWLINPNGVLFGQGAQVNVGSILASTLNPMGDSTTNGKQVFGNGGEGSIINKGSINAEEGYVAFIANKVSNQGDITANNGAVALGAGSQVTVEFAGSNLLSLTVDQSTLDNLAENKQLIKANGGMVLMSAGARDSLLASVVNNTGKIEAKTVQHKDGKIVLMGGMEAGTTKVAGTLDASADASQEHGNGGFIETSAANVEIAAETKVTTKAENGETGTWLIDPTDFNIEAGTGSKTTSSIGADTLSSNLANNNIQIETQATGNEDGDINVNAAVKWNAATELTLTAHNDININQSITAEHADGKLALEYGQANVAEDNAADYHINNGANVNLQAGDNFSTKLGSDGTTTAFKVITELGAAGSTTGTDLQGINGDVAGNYVLGADIDASATSGWNAGKGFAPIKFGARDSFTGNFDGLGHTVTNLTINRPTERGVGLFGRANASIRNIGLVGGSVTGQRWVGSLVGVSGYRGNGSTIKNAYATGAVTGTGENVGGLVGMSYKNTTISNAYATGDVTGGSYAVGGLVGGGRLTISNAYATGDVTGASNSVGGLVGGTNHTTISNAYATGDVIGASYRVGGLVGSNTFSTISNAYATGDVKGSAEVGGLVGSNAGTISNAYATGDVTGTSIHVGGLVGFITGSTITNVYATGAVEGDKTVGGLVGVSNDESIISNAYATGDVTGQGNDVGGLVGANKEESTISNAYATGAVEGKYGVGGLVGVHDNYSSISNAYATGTVTGTDYVGGLVGYNRSLTISNGYYSETTGQDDTGKGVKKTAEEMQQAATFAGWDISAKGGEDTVWRIYEGQTSPLLRSFMETLDLSAEKTQTISYNGGKHSFVLPEGVDANKVLGLASGTDAGTYDNNTYSVQQGYDIVDGDAQLIIEQKIIELIAKIKANDKTYDGTKTATVTVFSQDVEAGDNVSFSYATALFDTKDAGDDKTVTATGINIGGDAAKNYALQNTTATAMATINKANATVTANSKTVTYNGKRQQVTGFKVDGLVNGEGKHVLDTIKQKGGQGRNAGKYVHAITGEDNNYKLNFKHGKLTIDKKVINVSANAVDKEYDGNNIAQVNKLQSAGVIGKDQVIFDYKEARFNNRHAAEDKKVTVKGIYAFGKDANNYAFDGATLTWADIDAKAITVEASAFNKTYNGNKNAMVKALTAAGIYAKDNVDFKYNTAKFADKNVSYNKAGGVKNKVVKVKGIKAVGTQRHIDNYTFNTTATTKAKITPKEIQVSAVAENKTYNGNRKAMATLSGFELIKGDDISFKGRAKFNNKNVSLKRNGDIANKTVTVKNITATGADAGNYRFNTVTKTKAKITPKALDLAITADDKVYDGLTAANVSEVTASGILAKDTNKVSVNFSAATGEFADKNVGDDKAVEVQGISLTGKASNNYQINDEYQVEADITPKQALVSASADDKTYDANRQATLNALTSADVIGGDEVTFDHDTAKFGTKNVRYNQDGDVANKAVLVNGISASGEDATNYTFNTSTKTTAKINPLDIALQAEAMDKVYDGNRDAVATVASNELLGQDTVLFAGDATFGTKHARSEKNVTVKNVQASGADAGNYRFDDVVETNASITKLAIEVNAVADDKVYDGTTAANISSASSTQSIAGDDLGFDVSAAQGVFEDKNVGVDKNVEAQGEISLTGSDARNYSISATHAKEADITAKALTVSIVMKDKVYDGTTSATTENVSYTYRNGVVAGDKFWISPSSTDGVYAQKEVGSNIGVTFKGVEGHGADKGNYTFNSTVMTTGNITPKAVVVKPVLTSKVYDGSSDAKPAIDYYTEDGVLASDEAWFSFTNATGNFSSPSVGQDKTATFNGITIHGPDQGNYTFNTSATVQADILSVKQARDEDNK